jgi:hypothetical protein
LGPARFIFKRRVLVVVVTMAAFLSTSIGVLPSPRMIERLLIELRLASAPLGFESRERFPCEGCACSCGGAHECWSNCCCHTEQERIQWAIEQGVEPPATVRPSLLARYMRAKLEQAAVAVAFRELATATRRAAKEREAPALARFITEGGTVDYATPAQRLQFRAATAPLRESRISIVAASARS